MDSKEELSKLLFEATASISALLANMEFGKNDRDMCKANKIRKWLVELQDNMVVNS